MFLDPGELLKTVKTVPFERTRLLFPKGYFYQTLLLTFVILYAIFTPNWGFFDLVVTNIYAV